MMRDIDIKAVGFRISNPVDRFTFDDEKIKELELNAHGYRIIILYTLVRRKAVCY